VSYNFVADITGLSLFV